MYTVIGHAASRAFRVLWMLEELGLPYQHNPELPGSPDSRSLSPTGKLPVLQVDGETLIDSAAILTYLADHTGRLTCPAGTLARARQDGWTHLILDECDALLWMAGRHSFVLPEDQRVPEIKPSLRWEFARNLKRLAGRMGEDDYLMGAELTVPDILLGHCLRWAGAAKFAIEEPKLLAYFERLSARPAYQRAAKL